MAQKSGYMSDFYAREDRLKFSVFQPALLDILRYAETPLTLGLFGTWGSGKTSLLRMLKQAIDGEKLAYRRTIWFTAWKYERQEALWRAFLLRVVDGLYPRYADGERIPLEKIPDEEQRKGAAYLERLERALYEKVEWQEKGGWRLDSGALVTEGLRLPFWLAFHLAGLGEAAKELGLSPDLAKLLEREVRAHHIQQLQSMEQFAEHFESAIRLILGEEGRLIVFVDDLDRCLPEKAIEVLEAIKLFLDVPGTVFVLGMDREIVRRGVETHYKEIIGQSADDRDEMPVSGDVYLQKIIQIPFNLPPLDLDGRREFIRSHEKELPEQFRLDEVTREVLALGLFPNPRQAKRALNVFNLLRQVMRAQVAQKLLADDAVSDPLLAKAVLIQSQWSELYKLWRQYPTLLRTLEEEYERLRPMSEEEAVRGRSAEAEAGGAEKERADQKKGGLLDEYLRERRRYALLEAMLRYPPAGEPTQMRARFSGLSGRQMGIYLGLVGSVESAGEAGAAAEGMPAGWQSELLSGDIARINEALDGLFEREADPDGPLHRTARRILLEQAQSDRHPPQARAAYADALDRLGYVPDDLYDFIAIPSDTAPAFFIAKYPVTNLQYERFLKSGRFAERQWWVDFPMFDENSRRMTGKSWGSQGWEWLQTAIKVGDNPVRDGVLYPRYWDDPSFGIARKTAPVVGITWYEANAYCRWLVQERGLPEWGSLGRLNRGGGSLEIRLPAEAEWAEAAGGEANDRFAWGVLKDLVTEIVRYANTDESRIGRTTPVWMYPQGASPRRVMDLSGNVWEWQANFYDKAHEMLGLRGGSWDGNWINARVADRNGNRPSSIWSFIGFRPVARPV